MGFYEKFHAAQNGSWGGGGFWTDGSETISHNGGFNGGFTNFWIKNADYEASPNLTVAVLFNSSYAYNTQYSAETSGQALNRVEAAVVNALDAINEADWDHFPDYGFVEPPPSYNVYLGGEKELGVDPTDHGLLEAPEGGQTITIGN